MALVTIENSSDVTDTSCFDYFQHFIGRSINRTMLTVEGAMAGELLDGENKNGDVLQDYNGIISEALP